MSAFAQRLDDNFKPFSPIIDRVRGASGWSDLTLERSEAIPSFVSELVDAGVPICAVAHELYVIGDVDLPDEQAAVAWEICHRYGERDHLILEIVAYLRSVGRFLDVSREALH